MYFAIAGSSGCGKSTIINILLKEDERLIFIPSFTSRDPRPGEINGKTYTYVTKEEFLERIKNDEFLEYELVHDNYYGNSKKVVKNALDQNKYIIKDVDVKGVKNLDVKLKDLNCPLVKIFFVVPKGTLKKRLIARGEKELKKRLTRYKMEQSNQNDFDYIIINGDKDKENTLNIMRKIVDIGANYEKIFPTKPIEKFNHKRFKKYFEKLQSGETLSPCKVALVDNEIYLVHGHEKFVASMVTGKLVSKKFVKTKKVNKLSKDDINKYLEYIKTPIVEESQNENNGMKLSNVKK